MIAAKPTREAAVVALGAGEADVEEEDDLDPLDRVESVSQLETEIAAVRRVR